MVQFQAKHIKSIVPIVLFIALVTACGGTANTPTLSPATAAPVTSASAATATVAAPSPTQAAPTMAATEAPGSTEAAPTPTTASSDSSATVTLVVVPEKSEARYRVREQLAGVSLPSDAVGKTNAISGQIVGKMDGTIVSDQSKIVVDVRTLKSDQGMRDGFIQQTPLQTRQYPNVTFVVTSAPGLPLTPPASGPVTFQLIGNLTVRDVTKPVTWDATCQLTNGQTEGMCNATTTFTFADFKLEQPRVGRVISIEDNIKLEVDLDLMRQE